jgi:predicted  nucleic acid-binding Zn-ribbon protein
LYFFFQEGLIQGEIKKLKDELFALEAHIKEREGELKALQELIGSSKYDHTSITDERDELQDKRKYAIFTFKWKISQIVMQRQESTSLMCLVALAIIPIVPYECVPISDKYFPLK